MKKKGKRILYAVSGEGSGHAIRSHVMIDHLKKKNQVMVIGYDKSYEYLSKKLKNVFNIKGFNIVYENNRMNSTKTFLKFIRELPAGTKKNMAMLYRMIRQFKPHLVITDFEPFSSVIARIMSIPLISIDNQHIITRANITVPRKYYADKLIVGSMIRLYTAIPKRYLITTFFYPKVKDTKKVRLFPPILRDKIFKLKPSVKDHILIYQTSKSHENLLPLLKKTNEKYIIYGFEEDKKDKNLHFRSFNDKHFLDEFASCKAVITNGGFGLIGEALYLGKPILSVPIKKQFEQTVNAEYVAKLSYGEFHEELNLKGIKSFLSKMETYRYHITRNFKHYNNNKIFKEIDEIIERYSKRYALCPKNK